MDISVPSCLFFEFNIVDLYDSWNTRNIDSGYGKSKGEGGFPVQIKNLLKC